MHTLPRPPSVADDHRRRSRPISAKVAGLRVAAAITIGWVCAEICLDVYLLRLFVAIAVGAVVWWRVAAAEEVVLFLPTAAAPPMTSPLLMLMPGLTLVTFLTGLPDRRRNRERATAPAHEVVNAPAVEGDTGDAG